MKKQIILAALVFLCFASISAWSQIFVEFETPKVVGNRPYTPVAAGATTTVYLANQFSTPPNVDPDDGYVSVQTPFPFEFNGSVYNYILINVNGFCQFSPDGSIPFGIVGQQISTRMFDGSQFPRNVVAPFWADHYFRIGGAAEPGYMPSQILTSDLMVGGRRAFCVEWRNLNICDKTIPSSVGNFQLYLYQQNTIPGNNQGDIEFAYGRVGGNTNTTLQTVITRNASIGLKGSTVGGDWLNAFYSLPLTPSYRSTTLSNSWQPSGGSDSVFVFKAIPRLRLEQWGDGDADFSQAPGARHNAMAQNRYITASDAMTILRSVATNIPLDSLVKRHAYKGDVDHNGRFYYSTRNYNNTVDTPRYRREVRFRTPVPRANWTLAEHLSLGANSTLDSLIRLHTFNMPSDNSLDFGSVYFQVAAYDAALIMHYLGGRVVSLPWTLDSIVPYGKVGIGSINATDVKFDKPEASGKNIYRIPVMLNGNINGAVSAVFNVNAKVIAVESTQPNVMCAFNDDKVAIAGSAKLGDDQPIAYVTIETEKVAIDFSAIEFNDAQRSNRTMTTDCYIALSEPLELWNSANPFSTESNVAIQVPEDGVYNLSVYDILGHHVKTLENTVLSKGVYVRTWNGTNENGQPSNDGMYIYRLQGNGVNATKQIILRHE